jgi:RNA polymerase sigma-70 factor (ECF subfamily)
MDTVTSLVEHASNAETVSVAGTLCIALLFEGDVVGVLDVSTNSLEDGSTKIVALRVVTSAARLRAANRMLGRAAVSQLLARIQQSAMSSVAVGCDFPVDVHA